MTTLTNTPFTHAATVESSNLRSVFWDEPTETLVIEFISGSKAGYRDVPEYMFNNLVEADSPGRFYNSNIKPLFSGVSVGNLEMRVKQPQETKQPEVQDVTTAEKIRNLFAQAEVEDERGEVTTEVYHVTVAVEAVSITDAISVFGDDADAVVSAVRVDG